MAGNSSIRGDETITFTDNMSFDGTDRGGKMTTDGQLWIGSTSSNRPNNGGHVRLGSLTSPSGTITIGYSAPNITIDLAGGSLAIDSIAVDTTTGAGTNPVVPTAAGLITFTGGQYASGTFGTRVVTINSQSPNNLQILAQRSSAVSAADTTKNGISHFDSTSFTVDTNGFVQLNSPVAFYAYITASIPNVTGDATQYQIPFNATIFNVGSGFNTGTGVFTAPYAGIYSFSYAVQFVNIDVTHNIMDAGLGDSVSPATSIFCNGWQNPFVSSTTENGVTGYNSLTATALFQMTAGQTMVVGIQVRGGAKTVGISANLPFDIRTYFQGYLIART